MSTPPRHMSPHFSTTCRLCGEKPQNRPLSNRNTGALLCAMLLILKVIFAVNIRLSVAYTLAICAPAAIELHGL